MRPPRKIRINLCDDLELFQAATDFKGRFQGFVTSDSLIGLKKEAKSRGLKVYGKPFTVLKEKKRRLNKPILTKKKLEV